MIWEDDSSVKIIVSGLLFTFFSCTFCLSGTDFVRTGEYALMKL